MAKLIKADMPQEIVEVKPKNGTNFENEEIYNLLGCSHYQMIRTRSGLPMLCNEDAKIDKLPINYAGTEEYKYGEYDVVCGDVLICEHSEFI